MVTFDPIPPLATPDGTHRVIGIRESGEPIIVIERSEGLLIRPHYFTQGYANADDQILLRAGAVQALHRAAAALQPNYKLLVLDGLRSLNLQREIRDVAMRGPTAPSAQMSSCDFSCYVAAVPTSRTQFEAQPPPHCTGGAVDVTLAYPDGTGVDMGTEFDAFDERSWLRHYENTEPMTNGGPWSRLHGGSPAYARRVLYSAMTRAGFAPYEYEYWHYEIGTVRAAQHFGNVIACYGAAVPWNKNGDRNEP